MNGSRLKFCALVIVLAASILTPWWLWHAAQLNSRASYEAFRQQAEHLGQLKAENQRLSNQAAQARSGQTLPEAQQTELMKLRSEIGRLRAAVKETEKLRETNQKLRLAAAKSEPSFAGQSTADYWVKDQLAFSGYASPESALKTTLWAIHKGDLNTMLASMAPEFAIEMEKERQKDGKTKEEMAAELKQMAESLTAPSPAFRLLDSRAKSPDETVLTLSFEGEGKSRKFVMRKVGNEWKIRDMLFAGQDE